MNINELTPKLRKLYSDDLECGVRKSKDAKNGNIFFVVPPPPPIKIN
jgi:hypothetical protein